MVYGLYKHPKQMADEFISLNLLAMNKEMHEFSNFIGKNSLLIHFRNCDKYHGKRFET